jgi:HlyD family secretion protein
MFKNKKRLIFIAAAALLLIVVLVVLRKKGVIGKEQGVNVSTEIVQRRTLTETVTASGKIQPEVEVIINPDASGEIIDILVKEGDAVKKGDLLARINPDIYESSFEQVAAALNSQLANLSNAKARLAQVKAQYINAKSNYERNKKLFDDKAISPSEFDAVKTQYEVAGAEVEAAEQSVKAAGFQVNSAEANLKQSRDNLTKTSIFAPMDGTVSKLVREKGERVAGASQFSAGTEIMRIADLTNMEVNVNVSENDIVRVNYGDTTLVEVDAWPGRKFTGVVTRIASSAEVSALSADQVANFAVKIRILSESYADLIDSGRPNVSPFRPGMSANVDIRTKTALNVLTVPIISVTTRDDTSSVTGKTHRKKSGEEEEESVSETKKEDGLSKGNDEIPEYVFVFENGTVRLVRVETGIQDDMYKEIRTGLSENQEIVSAPYRAINRTLRNGQKVVKTDKDKLFSGNKE